MKSTTSSPALTPQAFHTNPTQVRRAFERAAPTYDAAAILQQEVANRMLERLDWVKLQPKRILDAGCGTGYASTPLQQRYPKAEILAIDFALPMLKIAAQKIIRQWWKWPQIWHKPIPYSPIGANIEALPLRDNSIDFIYSNATLHWLNQPDLALQEFHRVLSANGLLMFSTFGPDTLQELRNAFVDSNDNPRVHRFIDMHDLGDALARSGFADPVMDMEKITLTHKNIQSIVADLKATGAQNAAIGRSRGLMGKATLARAQQHYETLQQNGRLPVTYEIIYGHAWKPQPKALSDDNHQVITFHPRTTITHSTISEKTP